MYKIIGADGKEYGPVTTEQIRLWIHEGRLNGNSSIQTDGSSAWKQLREFPEFATLLPPPAAAPPPITFRSSSGTTPAAAYVPSSGTTNVLAIWALGTGIFTVICCQFLSPVSIVLGAIALSQIRQNPTQGGRGFAIAGIVLGAFSLLIALIAVTTFLVVPGSFPNLSNMFPK